MPRDARTTRLPSVAPRTSAALEPEPRGQPVEHHARLEDRVGHVVEARADVDQRLEIGAALAQLALVHRREDRRRQREQPERGHVEDRHPIEVDRPARDHVDRRHEHGGLGVQHDEQQQRVPQRDLEPGPVRRQQRHRDEMQVDEEADRALRRAGDVHRIRQEHAVHEERQAHRHESMPHAAGARISDAAAMPT